jgi:hypothetical protein
MGGDSFEGPESRESSNDYSGQYVVLGRGGYMTDIRSSDKQTRVRYFNATAPNPSGSGQACVHHAATCNMEKGMLGCSATVQYCMVQHSLPPSALTEVANRYSLLRTTSLLVLNGRLRVVRVRVRVRVRNNIAALFFSFLSRSGPGAALAPLVLVLGHCSQHCI